MEVKFSHKQVLVALVLTCCTYGARAQDMSFSQPYAAPLYLNPAYSGVSEFTRIGATCRYAGGQVGEPYTTYSLYADHYFDEFKSGVGLSAVSDRQAGGALTQSTLGASYAYNLRVAEKTFVRFGLQAQLGIISANADKLVFSDMVSPTGGVTPVEPYAAEQRTHFDMAVGSVFSHDIFFAGIALHHLMGSPDVEVLGQSVTTPRKFTLNAGCNIPIGLRSSRTGGAYRTEVANVLTITPNVAYWLQGADQAYLIGAYLNVKGFSTGLFYKSEFSSTSKFFSACAGYTSNLLSLMYSFDFGKMSTVTKAYTPSTHEISLTFKIKSQSRNAYRQQWDKPYRVQNTPVL